MIKAKTKIFILVFTILIVSNFAMLQTPVNQAKGADGTTGTIQIGYSAYVPTRYYTFILKDLTASSDYTLDFTAGCASQHNFSTVAGETKYNYYVQLNAPTTGSSCVVTLESQSTGVVVDHVRMQSSSVTQQIGVDSLIETIIILVVLAIILGMILGMAAWKKMR